MARDRAWIRAGRTAADPRRPQQHRANPFGAYLPEILRAEGINSFNVANLAAVNAATLTGVPLVVLAETPLTDGQVGDVLDHSSTAAAGWWRCGPIRG